MHRSAPTLTTPSAFRRGQGATDPLRGLHPWNHSTGGTGGKHPWSKPTVSSEAKHGYGGPKHREAPAWRPPGPSEGRGGVVSHFRPPPPPTSMAKSQPTDPPPGDMSTALLAAELSKTAQVLARAQEQMREERNISAIRAEEAEAQLAIATEMGRQEERQTAQAMVAEARGTLSALVDVHEQGAAFVKQNERAMLAAALAEQRRGLENEIKESRLATENEQAELRHAQEERHKRELRVLTTDLTKVQKLYEEATARIEELTLKLEQTREGRIDFYYEKAVKRMAKLQLTKGWNSLLEMYDEVRNTRQLINMSQGRLFSLMPTVRTAFSKWQVHERLALNPD